MNYEKIETQEELVESNLDPFRETTSLYVYRTALSSIDDITKENTHLFVNMSSEPLLAETVRKFIDTSVMLDEHGDRVVPDGVEIEILDDLDIYEMVKNGARIEYTPDDKVHPLEIDPVKYKEFTTGRDVHGNPSTATVSQIFKDHDTSSMFFKIVELNKDPVFIVMESIFDAQDPDSDTYIGVDEDLLIIDVENQYELTPSQRIGAESYTGYATNIIKGFAVTKRDESGEYGVMEPTQFKNRESMTILTRNINYNKETNHIDFFTIGEPYNFEKYVKGEQEVFFSPSSKQLESDTAMDLKEEFGQYMLDSGITTSELELVNISSMFDFSQVRMYPITEQLDTSSLLNTFELPDIANIKQVSYANRKLIILTDTLTLEIPVDIKEGTGSRIDFSHPSKALLFKQEILRVNEYRLDDGTTSYLVETKNQEYYVFKSTETIDVSTKRPLIKGAANALIDSATGDLISMTYSTVDTFYTISRLHADGTITKYKPKDEMKDGLDLLLLLALHNMDPWTPGVANQYILGNVGITLNADGTYTSSTVTVPKRLKDEAYKIFSQTKPGFWSRKHIKSHSEFTIGSDTYIIGYGFDGQIHLVKHGLVGDTSPIETWQSTPAELLGDISGLGSPLNLKFPWYTHISYSRGVDLDFKNNDTRTSSVETSGLLSHLSPVFKGNDKVAVRKNWHDRILYMPRDLAMNIPTDTEDTLENIINNTFKLDRVKAYELIYQLMLNSYVSKDAGELLTYDIDTGAYSPLAYLGLYTGKPPVYETWHITSASNLMGRSVIDVNDALFEKWMKRFGLNTTDEEVILVRSIIVALSQYIVSKHAIGEGYNEDNKLFSPWWIEVSNNLALGTGTQALHLPYQNKSGTVPNKSVIRKFVDADIKCKLVINPDLLDSSNTMDISTTKYKVHETEVILTEQPDSIDTVKVDTRPNTIDSSHPEWLSGFYINGVEPSNKNIDALYSVKTTLASNEITLKNVVIGQPGVDYVGQRRYYPQDDEHRLIDYTENTPIAFNPNGFASNSQGNENWLHSKYTWRNGNPSAAVLKRVYASSSWAAYQDSDSPFRTPAQVNPGTFLWEDEVDVISRSIHNRMTKQFGNDVKYEIWDGTKYVPTLTENIDIDKIMSVTTLNNSNVMTVGRDTWVDISQWLRKQKHDRTTHYTVKNSCWVAMLDILNYAYDDGFKHDHWTDDFGGNEKLSMWWIFANNFYNNPDKTNPWSGAGEYRTNIWDPNLVVVDGWSDGTRTKDVGNWPFIKSIVKYHVLTQVLSNVKVRVLNKDVYEASNSKELSFTKNSWIHDIQDRGLELKPDLNVKITADIAPGDRVTGLEFRTLWADSFTINKGSISYKVNTFQKFNETIGVENIVISDLVK